MIIKKYREKQKTATLFFIAFSFYIFLTTLSMSNYNIKLQDLLTLGRYACYLLFFICIIAEFYGNRKQLGLVLVLTVAAVIVSYQTRDNQILCMLLVLIASMRINFYHLLRTSIISKVFSILFVVLSFAIGLIPDSTNTRLFQTRIRHSLGFSYSNNLSVFFLLILVAYIIYKRNKLHVYDYIVAVVINYIINLFTDSSTSYYLTYAALMISMIFKRKYFRKREWNSKFYIFLTVCIYVMPIFFSIAYNESSQLFRFLNDNIAHNRLRLTHNAILYYGIKLFGSRAVAFSENNEIMVDSAIFRMLLFNGLFFYIVFLIIFIIMQSYFAKNQLQYINWMIIIVLLQGMMEAFTFDISSNFILLLIPITLLKTADNLAEKNKDRIRLLNNG